MGSGRPRCNYSWRRLEVVASGGLPAGGCVASGRARGGCVTPGCAC
jgi:hypothetical protein